MSEITMDTTDETIKGIGSTIQKRSAQEYAQGVFVWVDRSGKKPYKLIYQRRLYNFQCRLFAEDGSVIVGFSDSDTGFDAFYDVLQVVCKKYRFDFDYHEATMITRAK